MLRLDCGRSHQRCLITRKEYYAPRLFRVTLKHTLPKLAITANNNQPHRTEPPFTFKTSPVMCRAHRVHRKTIGQAMSSALATRPSGIVSSTALRYCASEKTPSHISVKTQPGATAFTLIPSRASSEARDFMKDIWPPFDAA